MEIVLQTKISGRKPVRGKVRDIYDLGDKLLIVATDRISAFDVVMANGIPYKGTVLTQISKFWFELLGGQIEHHLLSDNVSDLPKPFSNYAHVVTVEGAKKLVFCAGQVAADMDGKVLPPDDFAAQTKMVMKNLANALAAGGAKLSDVTKVTIYICNPHDVPKARGILYDYFGKHPPASTLCILRGLANPNFLLEIEAIAAV